MGHNPDEQQRTVHSYPKIRLFVEFPLQKGGTVTCRDEQAHYLSRVMRVKTGDELALFNGSDGEWRAVIRDIRKKDVALEIQEKLQNFLPPPDVWLLFAPLKFGRIDYLAQKATELGVSRLQPVITQYTQAERVNTGRLRANAIEAAEQCERVEVPEIGEPITLPKLLAEWPEDRLLLYGDESGQGTALPELISPSRQSFGITAKKWAVLIGPEGGFSDTERQMLRQIKAAQAVSLGPRILRADTAAIAMLSITQCAFGDWHQAPRFLRAEPPS